MSVASMQKPKTRSRVYMRLLCSCTVLHIEEVTQHCYNIRTDSYPTGSTAPVCGWLCYGALSAKPSDVRERAKPAYHCSSYS